MSEPHLEDGSPAEPIRLQPRPMARSSRCGLLAAAVALLGVFGVARWVSPDERGYGTHQQLGLPPCAFHVLTGIPCPSCGMTTSFAYVVRGRVVQAALTNAGGCVLAIGLVGMIPWCVVSAIAGRTIGLRSPERAAVAGLLIVIAVTVAGWLVRLILLGGQG